MTNAIATTGGNMQLPAHLQQYRNTALSGASATITNTEAKPMVKLDKGLFLVRSGTQVGRKSLIIDNAGVRERVPDMMDFVIMGWSEVTYAYFTPGQELGSGKPLCFSVGGVVPHQLAPQKQSAACKTCPRNQDGSGQNGKGKACSKRRVAIGYDYNDPEREIVALQIPTLSNWFSPKNVAGWYGFKDLINYYKANDTDAYFIVTRVVAATEDSKPRMNFAPVGFTTEDDLRFITRPESVEQVTEFRKYFEYEMVPADPTHTAAAATAPVGADAGAVAQLVSMLGNPMTAAAAQMALAAMGINVTPATPEPVVDPLAEWRTAFPGVPDVALEAMKSSGTQLPAPVVSAPAPVVSNPASVVSNPASVSSTPISITPPPVTPDPVVGDGVAVTPVAADADVSAQINSLRSFVDSI